MLLTDKDIQRFWSKVVKTPTCWYWQGCFTGNNRGSFQIDNIRYVPTEVMMMLQGQPRQGGLLLLHECDNKTCVNPEHLYWGTQTDNMQDRTARHSGWAKKGSTRCLGGQNASV